jgi:hypothetical protein
MAPRIGRSYRTPGKSVKARERGKAIPLEKEALEAGEIPCGFGGGIHYYEGTCGG